jgi:RNA polymerase sigma factor (TIGR02999 family)
MQADPSSARRPGVTLEAAEGRPRSPDPHPEITRLLRAWREGDASAFSRLVPLVYDELRARARRCIAAEGPGHLLQPTALVHEVYCRFAGSPPDVDWEDRGHFFAVAARAMRQILVDDARARSRRKRGGGRAVLSLSEVGEVALEQPEAVVALDDALTSLAAIDPLKASLIELRFFAGLTVAEAGRSLGWSSATVVRHWRAARAWLYRELSRGHSDEDA